MFSDFSQQVPTLPVHQKYVERFYKVQIVPSLEILIWLASWEPGICTFKADPYVSQRKLAESLVFLQNVRI